ncbi:MAG: sodium:proton antiporter [Saprospirales bacterium]|nr:sodium:proton antiporter [Saprospirales bacterium]
MKLHLYLTFLFLSFGLTAPLLAQQDSLATEKADLEAISVQNYQINVLDDGVHFMSAGANGVATFEINGEATELEFKNGEAVFPFKTDERGSLLLLTHDGDHKLYHIAKLRNDGYRIRHIPFWLSVLPPLIAIIMALLFKEVVSSLFLGVFTGAFIAGGLRIESLYYFLESIFNVVAKYVVAALTDGGHISVMVFSLLIGGMVAIISRNGGMAGVVNKLARYAKSPRSSQFVTWFLGVAIFFDDYANTLIVGNTMRAVTDRFRVSREKLAYIVDSTAAPVAAVAFITTWIGAELGYIDTGIKLLHNFDQNLTPYAIFLSSLKYSFYPVLTLFFILLLVYTNRDFGPMYKAEVRARTTGNVSPVQHSAVEEEDTEDLSPVPGAPLKWYHAVVPVLTVIFVTIYGLVDTGFSGLYGQMLEDGVKVASPSWSDVWAAISQMKGQGDGLALKLGTLIGAADSFAALLWSSFAGVTVAIIMTIWSRIMKLSDTISTMTTGFKAMLPALIILTFAWSLAITTEELHTATYLSTAVQGAISPHMLPVVVFILAAFISFSTGSSWSTMAILYPIAIPTAWAVCHAAGMNDFTSMEILLNVIAVVLGASVLGDHCSPISDTTILSSLASDCSHIEHVRTQLPYALTVGSVSIILCYLGTWFEGGWGLSFILLLIGMAILTGIVLWRGKKVPVGGE